MPWPTKEEEQKKKSEAYSISTYIKCKSNACNATLNFLHEDTHWSAVEQDR